MQQLHQPPLPPPAAVTHANPRIPTASSAIPVAPGSNATPLNFSIPFPQMPGMSLPAGFPAIPLGTPAATGFPLTTPTSMAPVGTVLQQPGGASVPRPQIPPMPFVPPPMLTRRGVPITIPEGPKTPRRTLYVRHLNERVKPDVMKQALQCVFSEIGCVQDIVLHQKRSAAGQAFVVMQRLEDAKTAVDVVQYFPLYGRPMVVQFAKQDADQVTRVEGGYEQIKEQREVVRRRLKEERKKRAEAAKAAAAAQAQDMEMKDVNGIAVGGAVPSSKPVPIQQIPDELQPPNKILFVQNLAPETTETMLTQLFGQYPGFKEVRLVSGKFDVAFVEFENAFQSGVAKGGLQGRKVDHVHDLKISFAKK